MEKISKRSNKTTRVQTLIPENYKPDFPTEQQHKDKVDVNNIVKKYQAGGPWPVSGKQGVYADLTSITDYQDMLESVRFAQNAFESLPAQIRDRFQNDPENMLAFLQNPANKEEAIKLGLVQSEPVATNDKPNDKQPPVQNQEAKKTASEKNSSGSAAE